MFTLELATTNSSLDGSEPWTPVRSLAWLIVVGFIYGFIILFTVVGNAFIIAAYVVDIKIRSRASSMLIVNLAIADFGIGITFIFNFVFLVYDAWPLGEIPCKLWIVLDYTCSYMSVIAIMLISLDRYWMVKKKLEYRSFQTKRRILITAVICWIAVITFYTITAFGYGALTNTNHVDFTDDCEMEYLYSIPFSAVMIFVEFVIPLICIVYLNIVVYTNVRMRSGGLVRSKPKKGPNGISKSSENLEKSFGTDTASGLAFMSRSGNSGLNVPVVTLSYAATYEERALSSFDVNGSDKDTSNTLSNEKDTSTLYNASISEVSDGGIDCSFESEQHNAFTNAGFQISNEQNETETGNANNNGNQKLPTTKHSPLKVRHNAKRSNETQLTSTSYLSASDMTLDSVSDVSTDGDRTGRRHKEKRKKKSLEIRRQRRAAILLFVLVIAFAICWLPYQIATIIMTVVGDEAVPELIAEIVANLLWCNSTINPLLYAVITTSYRRNFLKFLGLSNVARLQKKCAKSSNEPTERNITGDPLTSNS